MQSIDLKNIDDFKLHPLFAQSIIFYSNPDYLNLSLLESDPINRECKLYGLLELGLLKYAFGEITKILVNYNDKNGNQTSANIKKSIFFNHLYQKKCFKNKEQNLLFTKKNLKHTFEQFNFTSPKTMKQCYIQYKEYQTHPLIGNFCKIHEAIKKGRKAKSKLLFLDDSRDYQKISRFNKYAKELNFYNTNISFYKRNFIKTICSNLNSSESFCLPFMQDDVWTKILNGEKPNYLIDYKCRASLGNLKSISVKQRELCAQSFRKNPEICTIEGNQSFPSLFPMPKCTTIDKALKNSRLKTDYHDCPGFIDNESIINIHRILTHITNRKINTNAESCSSESNISFFNLNRDFKNKEAWPLNICFMNKATEKEECRSYIPGENSKSKLSEHLVVADILYKTESARFNIKCKIVSDKKYNPAKLKYRNGCFIIYQKNNCTSLHCPKNVILNKKPITHLKYKGQLLFQYIPNAFSSNNFAATNMIEKIYKKRSKPVLNLTELKYYFSKKTKGIIHGIGCAEDLLPQHMKKETLNQCRPLPFIIDGITKDDQLVIRTALHDLHSPGLIHWSFVFGAVANYKNIHPLKTWAFYGLY